MTWVLIGCEQLKNRVAYQDFAETSDAVRRRRRSIAVTCSRLPILHLARTFFRQFEHSEKREEWWRKGGREMKGDTNGHGKYFVDINLESPAYLWGQHCKSL